MKMAALKCLTPLFSQEGQTLFLTMELILQVSIVLIDKSRQWLIKRKTTLTVLKLKKLVSFVRLQTVDSTLQHRT